jgi:hypothetical protein
MKIVITSLCQLDNYECLRIADPLTVMLMSVAFRTQRDQVFRRIGAPVGARGLVMNLKIGSPSA